MNPLDAWILRHARATWAQPGTRAGYEAVYGPLTNQEWASALGRVYQAERVQQALQAAPAGTLVGTVLAGLLATRNFVVVPIRITGTDALGYRFSAVIQVQVTAANRIGDIFQLAGQAAASIAAGSGINVTDVDVASGSYSL